MGVDEVVINYLGKSTERERVNEGKDTERELDEVVISEEGEKEKAYQGKRKWKRDIRLEEEGTCAVRRVV